MEDIINQIGGFLAAWGLKLVAAIVIFVIGKWVARWLSGIVKKLMEKSNVDATLVKFVGNGVYILLMVFVILAALGKLGVPTTSAVAILGAAGLAIGLALQGSLANFASGVLLILFRPFKAGDFVEAGGTMGVVEEITIFTTLLKTPDNKAVIVPNANITGGNITNFSAKDTRRVDLVFGIGYGDDIKKAKQLLHEIVDSHELILKDPAPTIGVAELADSSVNFAVRPWVNAADYWTVFFDLNETVKERFDAEGISIPFPQQDVHMHTVSA